MKKAAEKKQKSFKGLKAKTIILLAIFILVLLVFYVTGVFSFLDMPVNSIIAGSPDKSCRIDADCVIKSTNCQICSCGESVNKNWNEVCPFKAGIAAQVNCKPCQFYEAVCVNNRCERSEKY